VPVLISLLKNPDTNIKSKAIRAIGNFGADAKPALPHLYELLEDQESCDSDVREALLKIDPEAPAKLQKYPPPAD
jgi:HEAT repeat protein